ncbi:hypothetical protein B566_EDAN010602 [Ephemera danica]|nr:hypothetical protein B566_EDAN010602 [Ephemera danica]
MSVRRAVIPPSPVVGEKTQKVEIPPTQKEIKNGKKKEKTRGVRREKKPDVPSRWDELPDLILERVFSYLSIRDRYNASQACRRWYEAFYLPYVWSTFVMGDSTLVRRKFNYYMGWQNCLATVGRNIKTLVFEPMYNFYNLYEFMVMLSYYAERHEMEQEGKVYCKLWLPLPQKRREYEILTCFQTFASTTLLELDCIQNFPHSFKHQELHFFLQHEYFPLKVLVDVRGGGMGIGSRISTLRFTFPCNMAHSSRAEDEYIFGTGGRLLEAFKRLMGSLGRTLRHLQLVDLLLERHEALKLLDDVCYSGCETLESLELVNVTKVPCQLIHPGVFVRLQVLVLSPQTLGVELLQLLGSCATLRHLHVLQNRYTPERQVSAPWRAWRQCRRDNPQLSVHLEAQNTREGDVVWQQCAPVRSILYKSPYIRVSSNSVLTAIDQYRSDLEVYGHLSLPRFHRSSSFHDRADSLLLLLCRQCPNIHTLIIRERVSTATVLLLAYTGQNLRFLHVRRNAVILKCDWPRSPEWSEVFYSWLRAASRSYEATEREISQILGYSWSFLSDRQFKLTAVDVHQSPFYHRPSRASFHTYVPPPPLPTPVPELLPDTAERKRRDLKKVKVKKPRAKIATVR